MLPYRVCDPRHTLQHKQSPVEVQQEENKGEDIRKKLKQKAELMLLGPFAGKCIPLKHGTGQQKTNTHKGVSGVHRCFSFSPVGFHRLPQFPTATGWNAVCIGHSNNRHECVRLTGVCVCVYTICMWAFNTVTLVPILNRMSMKFYEGYVYTAVKKSK